MAPNERGGAAVAGTGPAFTQLQAGVGLYRADPAGVDGALALYYAPLIGDPGSFPPKTDAATAWQSANGAFLFAPASTPISGAEAQGVVNALTQLLEPVPSRQWVVWTPDPDAANLGNPAFFGFLRSTGSDLGTFQKRASAAFANLSLQIDAEVKVAPAFDGNPAGILLKPIEGTSKLTLVRLGETGAALTLPADKTLLIPFAGATLGCWAFAFNPNAGDFYTLFADANESPPSSAEFRYVFGGSSPTTLRFPVLLGEWPLTDPTVALPMNVVIDPLRPTLSSRTRFIFDLAQYGGDGRPILPTTQAFVTAAGRTLQLQPQEGSGFSLGWRPTSGGRDVYLTPTGRYQISVPPAPKALAAKPIPIAQGALEVLCGIYGTEFLLIAEKDYIEFLGNSPANAFAFSPPGQPVHSVAAAARAAVHGGEFPLDDQFTANWAKVVPGPNSGKTFPAFVKQSYCAQAANAVYYQSDASSGYPFPIAVGVRLGDLSHPDRENPFPMVPYSYVFFNSQNAIVRGQPEPIDNPNPNVPGAVFEAFEAQVLSRARRTSIKLDRCLGPMFFDMGTLNALAGGYVQTASGLIVALNDGEMNTDHPAGSYRELLLARSPENHDQWLRFKAGSTVRNECDGEGPFQVVSPFLSTAMMEASPFIVISSKNNIGGFDNEIRLGEYTFRIDVSGSDANPSGAGPLGSNCALVFKQSAGQSFWDLAQDVASWSDADVFVGDAATANRLSAQIVAWMKEAEKKSKEADSSIYFTDLIKRLTDPQWTGIIALNVPLDYEALPADVQMLLGGMRSGSPLRGHHFGITLNKVKSGENAFEALEKSSLFALIYYDQVFEPPQGASWSYDFQCLQLKALFDNSVIKHFNSRIAFSSRQLFADPVHMVPSAKTPHDFPNTNTIVIDGVLQVQDGVTHIVFATSDDRQFSFAPKSGQQYRVLDVQTASRAAMAPVTGHAPTQSAAGRSSVVVVADFALSGGLAFTKRGDFDLFSYGLDKPLAYTSYAFEMKTTIQGDSATLAPIKLKLTNFSIDPSAAKPRDKSLIASLPLKVEGFKFDVTAAGTGGKRVSGVGLDSAELQFAFSLKLVMGTLGALSDSGPLEGALLLGWTAGGSDAAADKTGMLLVPPEKMADGKFRLQGVIPTQFGNVKLLRPTINDKPMYVLSLNPIQMWLGGFPIIDFFDLNKSLTFFGKPDTSPTGTSATKLSWVLGRTDLDSTAATAAAAPKRAVARRERLAAMDTSNKLAVTPAVIVLSGIKLNVDTQKTSVIGEAMKILADIPLSTKDALEAIAKGKLVGANYDPSAGITVGIDLEVYPFSFTGVFNDPYIYGAQLKIAKPKPPAAKASASVKTRAAKKSARLAAANGNGKDDNKGGWQSVLGGTTIEIVYRKISSDLGVWSTSFNIPKSFDYGEGAKIGLPTIGLAIYTNTDFRVDAGWPFYPAGGVVKPFSIDFKIGGWPVRFAAGAYVAKLRSADSPEEFGTEFSVIWRFGIGLAFGLFWEKKFAGGIVSLSAGLFGVLQFQGFLASKTGDISKNLDYWWFAGQIGIDLELSGSVDFIIITASLSVSATLYLNLVLETRHKTVINMVFHLEVTASVKIIFIRIYFKFSMDVELFTQSFGSGPEAKLTGPTPNAKSLRMRAARSAPATLKAIHPMVLVRLRGVAAVAPAPIAVTLHLTLAPTTVVAANHQPGAPQMVATLLAEIGKDDKDGFSAIVQGLAQWLAKDCVTSPLSAQLDCMKAKLDNGSFENSLGDFLSQTFVFTIQPTAKKDKDAAVLPMFPQLKLAYGGIDIPFNAPPLPSNYVKEVADYFRQLNATKQEARPRRAMAAAALPQSAAGMIATDAYSMIGKHLVSQLRDWADKNPSGTLEAGLAALDYDGLAGFVSRFTMHGLCLPNPYGGQQVGLYQLTRQQIQLTKTKNAWNTDVVLGYADGAASSFIHFPSGSSLTESMGASLAMDEPVDTGWLSSGGGVRQLPPIRLVDQLFHIGESRTWTKGAAKVNLRIFPDQLLQQIDAYFHIGTSATAGVVTMPPDPSTDGKQGAPPAFVSIPSTAALFVPLTLAQIAGAGGKPLKNVYQLIGTDDQTRSRLDDLLDAMRAQPNLYKTAQVDFLITTGSSTYESPAGESGIVLAKANLSTLSQPPRMAAGVRQMREMKDQPPSSATLADVQKFIELVWELSAVHATGFYIHVQNVPDGAFQTDNGRAEVALLITFASAADRPPLAPYNNALLLDPARLGDRAPAAKIYDQSGIAWSNAVSGYLAGRVGFQIDWPNAPQAQELPASPTSKQKQDYLRALYGLLQYRVEGLTPHAGLRHAAAVLHGAPLPSNWSLPLGPRDGDDTSTTWHYAQTFPVAYFLQKQNRYAGIGATVQFGIRLLDVFGNALPSFKPAPMPVVYNDKLVPASEWPGTNVNYTFQPGTNNHALLCLLLSFDPGSLAGSDDSALQQARDTFHLIFDQLTDPLQAGSPNAGVELETVLAAAPLTAGSDGTPLRQRLVDFVTAVVNYLDALLNKQAPAPPAPCTFEFALDRSYAAALPSDVFQLTAALKFFRDPATIDPDIQKQMPAVQWAVSSITPLADLKNITQGNGDTGPDSNFRGFAQAFETAWAGFDGADGELKLGDGETGSQSTHKRAFRLSTGMLQAHDPDASSHRPLWCVRMGKIGGINVVVPNAASVSAATFPVFYAPKPLSTQLITRAVAVRQYKDAASWNGTGSDVAVQPDQDHTFTNIDMDAWGQPFTLAFDQLMTPEMATAIATLDADRYAALTTTKENLADAMRDGLESILSIPHQDVSPGIAKERFRQALLTALATNYTLSSAVEVPVTVSLKGDDAPASFYGQVTPQTNVGLSDSFALSPVKFKLTSSENPVYLASAKNPTAQAFLKLDPTLNVSFLEHDYGEAHFSYVPSSWVSFVAPFFVPPGIGAAPLSMAMGKNTVPVPLRAFPQTPAFQMQKVGTAQNPQSVADALLWSYAVDVLTPDAPQDTLVLTFQLNDPVTAKPERRALQRRFAFAGSDDDPARPPPKDLFEALARFTFEYPQMAPALATVPAAAFQGGNKIVAKKVLERFQALADGVAAKWHLWKNPGSQDARAQLRQARAAANVLDGLPPQHWTYRMDFQSVYDGNLAVSRSIEGSNAYPPWLDIDGFKTPTNDGAEATYIKSGNPPTPGTAATYRFTLPKLFLISLQSVHASAEGIRNVNLVPEEAKPLGATVNNDFIYMTPIVSQKDPQVPYLNPTNTIWVDKKPPSLSAAIDDLLAPFLANPTPSAPAPELRLTLDCQYLHVLSQASETQTVSSRLPTVLARREIVLTGEPIGDQQTIAAFKHDLVSALSAWHANFQPSDVGASLKFGAVVMALISETPLPLANFSDLRIPVPANNPGWWSA